MIKVTPEKICRDHLSDVDEDEGDDDDPSRFAIVSS